VSFSVILLARVFSLVLWSYDFGDCVSSFVTVPRTFSPLLMRQSVPTSLASPLSTRSLSVFFFQAEDGIRDSSVTGVQTCALPIYLRRVEHDAWHGRAQHVEDRIECFGAEVIDPVERRRRSEQAQVIGAFGEQPVNKRSEERRVGKEGTAW